MCLLIAFLNSVNEYMIFFHCNMRNLAELTVMKFL
uniref:Uncharacterized protein n=1 Tax=Arundo donax TaxID=35708 RepID=A0A0A9DEF7_ARUDO